ncbi:hypothetical protein FZI95_21330 [Mycobacterium sp. CBMA247]|nr:hypothetical protein [Mycolicibacterium sp. CBMA 329]MUL88698.1 hypothetical protein [Mycolicibacterium sp. CBMA 331]MUM02008.1 hypothetical protein [Mycolicibacterium sp. CBMA 334]MUM26913.1 hypothetical protein [Mycolicibacterium sp. CBMA 295]MUM40345.1 hypothetical protein [Mycolicibacterium sp. CBMA 247]MUM44762.1 hypothetical protein [Mycolicibacterium sp. CBMA 294]
MRETPQSPPSIPRWLHFVMAADRAGSAAYVGTGFLFAPVLAMVSPWPALTTALWIAIALAGLWLGLLGIAMATGLAIVLRSNAEIPEDYWRSIIDYPSTPVTQDFSRQRRRGNRPANV